MRLTPGIDLCFCWAFGDADPVEKLTLLRSSGFEGIELWPDALRARGARAWAEACSATEMRVFQLCPYFNFVEGADRLARSRSELDEFLAAAKELGCSRLRVFTGDPWGERMVGASQASESQWNAAIDGLREYCDEAARYDIELCLECHGGSLMEDSPNALRLIHAVDRPNLTVNLQLPLVGESWEIGVANLGVYTTHIHIHNWTKALGEGELTNLADGVFDWDPVLVDLVVKRRRRITLSVEHADHSRGDNPDETARLDGPWLHALRGRIMDQVTASN